MKSHFYSYFNYVSQRNPTNQKNWPRVGTIASTLAQYSAIYGNTLGQFSWFVGKDLISRYFSLIGLNGMKTDSLFKFALKDMYNISYIQTLFYKKNSLYGLRSWKRILSNMLQG